MLRKQLLYQKFRKLFKRKSSFYYSAHCRKIRIDTDADFIVVGNKEGIRYAHPRKDKIGEAMVGGDNKGVLLEGKSYVSKATGSLGPSLRGKVPIRNQENAIIGVVSVGFQWMIFMEQ